jgi:hypothetical protein
MSWQNQYRQHVNDGVGEAGFTLRKIFVVAVMIMVLFGALSTVAYAMGWFASAARVAERELSPEAINRKYGWFKDAAAQIRAKQQTIEALRNRNAKMEKRLGASEKWQRTDRETMAQYEQELTGAIAMYNGQVAEYNSEMSKWHTKFANFGAMPQGWEDAAPKGFPEYKTE